MRAGLVGVLVALSLVFPSAALAHGCDPHGMHVESSWHAGAINDGYPEVNGVTAYLWQYRPYVKDEEGDSFSGAWVMLNQYDEWAQVGWDEQGGIFGTRRTFIQYTRPGEDWLVTRFFGGEPDWTWTQTTVLYENVGGQMMFLFFSDNVEIFRANAWWDPQEAQVSSEINNLENQMAGQWDPLQLMDFHTMRKRTNQWWAFAPTWVGTSDNDLWYASNMRGGMDPLRELKTADKRGDCG